MMTDERIGAIVTEVTKGATSLTGPYFLLALCRAIEQEVKDAMCKAIKEEDDHCADGDYMLDSDDCISVIRGKWNRPDYSCGEKK